jgi:hypothetical protein
MAISFSGNADAVERPYAQRTVGNSSSGFSNFFEKRNQALAGTHKYVSSNPFFSGIDSAAGVKGYIDRKNATPRDEYGGLVTRNNSVSPYRVGDYMFSTTGDGRYYALNTKDPTYGTGQTKGDVYDASGKYLGSQYFDTKTSGISKLIDKAIPLAATAFIGGGIAGGLGYGPFAGGASPGAAAMGAGEAAGFSGAAAGDAGLMYAGADAAAAGSLGGGYMGGLGGTAALGGAAAAGGVGGSGGSGMLGSLGNIIKGGGGMSDYLGLGSTILGALGGAQGQEASTSSTRSMDPRMDALFYGNIAPKATGLLGQQMPGAASAGQALMNKGRGLLGQTAPTTATNPYLDDIADDLQRRTQEMLGANNLSILGGSRQGVAQGIAAGRAADSLQGQIAGLYGNAYEGDQNRLRQDWTLGSGMMNQGVNLPFQPLQNTASIFSPFTGFGTTTNNASSGGGAMGAIGGALAGASMGRQMGWW